MFADEFFLLLRQKLLTLWKKRDRNKFRNINSILKSKLLILSRVLYQRWFKSIKRICVWKLFAISAYAALLWKLTRTITQNMLFILIHRLCFKIMRKHSKPNFYYLINILAKFLFLKSSKAQKLKILQIFSWNYFSLFMHIYIFIIVRQITKVCSTVKYRYNLFCEKNSCEKISSSRVILSSI